MEPGNGNSKRRFSPKLEIRSNWVLECPKNGECIKSWGFAMNSSGKPPWD